MKFAIKDYKEAIKNVEKFAKEKGIKLDAYDFEFLCDGYNCQLTWNPASHIMPYSETGKDFYGKEITTYYTYFQLSQKCSSICSSTGVYNKELILEPEGPQWPYLPRMCRNLKVSWLQNGHAV